MKNKFGEADISGLNQFMQQNYNELNTEHATKFMTSICKVIQILPAENKVLTNAMSVAC